MSSLTHKQWVCLALSAATVSIAKTTEDNGLDHFQVAFGDECVAVASQHFPVGKRMSQVSEVPKNETTRDGVRRRPSPRAKGWMTRKRAGKKDRLQDEREKISLDTEVCLLTFPCVQVPPVSARSGQKPEGDH